MTEIEFSNAAVADLDAIDDYSIMQFGEIAAETYMRGFDEAFALLQHHPLAGPANAELGKSIRCLVHRKHRIFYIAEGDKVLVLRVIHQAMNAKRTLSGKAFGMGG